MAKKKQPVGKVWSEEERQRLVSMKNRGKSWPDIGKALGRSGESARKQFYVMRESGAAPASEIAVVTPPGATVDRSTVMELELELNDVIVASDFHVPGESREWIDKLLSYAHEHGVKHLIIAGDFWNHDSISRWQMKDPNLNLKLELKKGIALVRELQKQFSVYFLCGNHDSRLPKALDYSLNFTDWMDALFGDSVTVTDFDFLRLTSGGRQFRVCHPDSYSRVKGSQASLLAQDLHENVIVAHQHYISASTNKTGRYLCVDCGCMCDKNLFYYKKSTTTRFPEWENGFIHVKNGKVRVVCDYTF